MVRYYHRTGALPEPPRSANGYREYRVEDVARLVRLTTLTRAGVPVSDICDAEDDRDLLRSALTAVEEHIAALFRQKEMITEMLGGPHTVPADVNALMTDLHDQMAREEVDHLFTQDLLALQLMTDTGMTTPGTWNRLRATLADGRRRALTLNGYLSWIALSELSPGDPSAIHHTQTCITGFREGVFSGLRDTLVPGSLPLDERDLPTEGAQALVVRSIMEDMNR